ncbi:MAG: peptidase U32 family protein [Motiliproteus sp.]
MVMIMAPGGTKEMALGVLDAGADATYVGVQGWSRRGNKDELQDDDIHEVIDYALERDKNVRIVVNTLPSSTEIPMFLERVKMYHEWGAKGFMISDVGCMKLVNEQIPTAEIHTSVGCGITNYADVHFLSELGATYVVLPYRLSVEEIRQIKQESNVGIEVFLFKTPSGGKICPGKCMMSSYFSFERWLDETGKDHFFGSASRGGDCLRVCQTMWDLESEQQLHGQEMTIKSNPSLWLTELPDYLSAGVECLKVPGRDRSAPLVMDLTNCYRRAVDEILSCDAPNLQRYEIELQQLRHRWQQERSKRDDRLIDSALAASSKALISTDRLRA